MSVQLKKSLTIIVATLVIEDDNILMVQEAKPECLGLWYLPAGRLERHESIVAGARRECKEEAGLDIDIVRLMCVEMQSPQWIRISFEGRRAVAGGGQLKRVPDKESLAAAWVPLAVVLAGGNAEWGLRGTDIVGLVQRAVQRRTGGGRLPAILPTETPHDQVHLQLFVVARDNSLLTDASTHTAPIISVAAVDLRSRSISRILNDFFRHNIVDMPRSYLAHIFVLAIEFSGTPRGNASNTDGVQLDLLIRIECKAPLSAAAKPQLQWTTSTGVNWHRNLAVEADDNDLPALIVLR